MGKISEWFQRMSTGWMALAMTVAFLLFTILVLPGQASSADAGAEDVGSPDLSFFYTPDDLYRMAEAYGEQGRSDYVRVRFTFDLIWPLVYTAFLVSTIGWLYSLAFAAGSRWRMAILVPLLGALFDFLENIATSLVMVRYPARTPTVDLLAPVFTLVKWILVGGSFVLLVVGAAIAVWRWYRERGNARREESGAG